MVFLEYVFYIIRIKIILMHRLKVGVVISSLYIINMENMVVEICDIPMSAFLLSVKNVSAH